jgi:galactonate dehydratase
MKITEVKTFIVHPGVGKNLIFVKLQTDEGLYGWGESYTQSDRDTAIVEHIKQMERYLVGRSPFNIKHFTHVMYEDFATKRTGMDYNCAISGIEQAMWDIVGKAAGMPVYNLLGGACRDRIRVYGNGWSEGAKTPDEFKTKASEAVKAGWTALKFDPFPGPWKLHIDKKAEQLAADRVAAVREGAGPDADILVEVHRRLAPMHAIRVAKMIEPYNIFWYEEPCPAENLDAIAEVRRATSIPIVTGEALYTKSDFRHVFEKRAADIINPDISNTGGILELKEISAMAEPHYVIVSPHGWNSTTVSLAASIQVSACIPNFLIMEFPTSLVPLGEDIAVTPFRPVNGYIKLPTAPGLGIDLKEDALARHGYKQFPPRRIRQVQDEGP